MSGFCHFVSYLAFRQFFSYLSSITVSSVNVASYQFSNGDEWGLLYFLFPERKEAFYYTEGQVSLAFDAWDTNTLGRKSKRLLKKEYKKHIWAILPCVCPPTTGQAVACSPVMSEVRLRLCSICIDESTGPFEVLFMLLQCVILWWWLAQFNFVFSLGNHCVSFWEPF